MGQFPRLRHQLPDVGFVATRRAAQRTDASGVKKYSEDGSTGGMSLQCFAGATLFNSARMRSRLVALP